jgi:hypothetical protein
MILYYNRTYWPKMWRNSARCRVITSICIPFAGCRTCTVSCDQSFRITHFRSELWWRCSAYRVWVWLVSCTTLFCSAQPWTRRCWVLSCIPGATTAVHGRTSLSEFRRTEPFTLYGCLIMRVGHCRLCFVKGVISVFSKVMDKASRLGLGWIGALECSLQIEEVGHAWF